MSMTESFDWLLQVTVVRQGRSPSVETFALSRITLGGAPDNHVVLSDPFVSGRHGWVSVSEGMVIYHDCSRNGSFIAGRRIERQELAADDVVSIPPYELRFELVISKQERHTQLRETHKIPFDREAAERLRSLMQDAARQERPPIVEDALADKDEDSTRVHSSIESALGFLWVEEPEHLAGRRFTLGRDPVRIGRGDGVHLRFDLSTLSRHHATLRHDGRGWLLEDENSSNGTFVNGRRVGQARLRLGDILLFGRDLRIVLRQDGNPEPPAAPEPSFRESTGIPVVHIQESRSVDRRVVILRLRGRVDGYNYTVLGERLDRLIDARERRILIHLGELGFIDHTGLGVLVNASTRLQRLGGDLRLVGVGPRLRDAFELSRLDGLFKGRIAANEDEALQELQDLGR